MREKYRILADALRLEIRQGSYAAAGKLPTEAELAARWQVSRQTVRRALAALAEEGLIVRRQGSGSHLTPAGRGPQRVVVALCDPSASAFRHVLDDIQSTLYASALTPVLWPTGDRVSRERAVLEQVLREEPCGLLMEGVRTALPDPNLDLYRQLRARGIPTVFLYGAPEGLEEAVCISEDDRGGGYLLTRHLAGQGHRQIGAILKGDDRRGRERYLGYALALHDAGLELDERWLAWFTTEDLRDLLDGGDPWLLRRSLDRALGAVSAVVCHSEEIAYQLVRLLRAAGRRVPEDVSVVSFDRGYYQMGPPTLITSLTHGGERPGLAAARELAAMISGQPGASRSIPWTLVRRGSDGPVRRGR